MFFLAKKKKRKQKNVLLCTMQQYIVQLKQLLHRSPANFVGKQLRHGSHLGRTAEAEEGHGTGMGDKRKIHSVLG
jgi:hypothetical protein